MWPTTSTASGKVCDRFLRASAVRPSTWRNLGAMRHCLAQPACRRADSSDAPAASSRDATEATVALPRHSSSTTRPASLSAATRSLTLDIIIWLTLAAFDVGLEFPGPRAPNSLGRARLPSLLGLGGYVIPPTSRTAPRIQAPRRGGICVLSACLRFFSFRALSAATVAIAPGMPTRAASKAPSPLKSPPTAVRREALSRDSSAGEGVEAS